jgi:nucleotide-binding universal stress UspA family protein
LSTAAPVAEPTPGQARFRRILLASEGRPIPPAAVARVVELAEPGANVHVFTIARIHGTAFGMPSPGLFPTKKDWAAQRDIVAKTIKRLERKGLAANGQVLGTRNATKKILEEAKKEGCEAIVMAADADRNRVTGNMMWSQEPQRVRRKAKLPVYLVPDE